jgi:hypothetical protein
VRRYRGTSRRGQDQFTTVEESRGSQGER